MKSSKLTTLAAAVAMAAWASAALPAETTTAGAAAAAGDEIVARQGDVVLSVDEFHALVREVPDADRSGFAQDPDRLTLLVKNALLARNLAKQAEDAGAFDERELEAALEVHRARFLAGARMRAIEAAIEYPDFKPLAREMYLADKVKYFTQETVDIEYIVLDPKKKGLAATYELAESLRAKAIAGEDFAALIALHTDEPQTAANQGQRGKASDLVVTPDETPFNDAVRKLSVGEVAEPYMEKGAVYLVKIAARVPASKLSFETVETAIVAELREKHRAQVVSAYLDSLRAAPVEFNEEILPDLREAYASAPSEK